jgi:hypothetical protein
MFDHSLSDVSFKRIRGVQCAVSLLQRRSLRHPKIDSVQVCLPKLWIAHKEDECQACVAILDSRFR